MFDGNVIGNRKVKNKYLYRVRYSGDIKEYEEEELLKLLV